MAKTLEQLAKEIYNEALEDGEPVTEEEALEMAKMELGSKEMLNYTQATVKKERKKVERKVDENKVYILDAIQTALRGIEVDSIDDVKPETESSFTHGGNAYTVKLIKHRPPKK